MDFTGKRNCCSSSVHRWFVFVSACLSMAIDVGFIFSSGALFVNIMCTYNTNRTEAALVQSVLMAVRFGTGMFSGAVVQTFGPLKAGLFGSCLATLGLTLSFFSTSVMFLVFSMGLLLAMGSSCLFISSSVAVGQHFAGKTGLILMSAQSAGGGLGGMLYPFVLEYLGDKYGLRGTLLIVAGLYAQLIPASLLWKSREENVKKERHRKFYKEKNHADLNDQTDQRSDHFKGKSGKNECILYKEDNYHQIPFNPDEETVEMLKVLIERRRTAIDDTPGKTDRNLETGIADKDKESVWESLKQLALNPSFVLFAVGMGVAYPALGILFIFIVDLFLDAGLTDSDASLGLLLVHMFSILGRLLPGVVMQSRHLATLSVPIVAAIVTSAVMVGLALVQSLEVDLFLCCLIGVPYGMFVSVFSVTSLKLVGIKRLSNAIGVLFTLNGLGSGLAGPISGLLRDSLGSYTIPFLIAAGIILAGALLFCTSLQIRRMNKHYVIETSDLLTCKPTEVTNNQLNNILSH